MEYIGILIYLLPLLVILTAAIFAFLAQKNWATVTIFLGILLLLAAMGVGIYASNLLMKEFQYSSDSYEPSERYNNIILLAQILVSIAPLVFITGLIGFMNSSRSIYKKADALMQENNELSIKLNQL